MNELYNEVENALDGLVIPPLQHIINKFLPDRAILSSPRLLDFIKRYPRVRVERHFDFRTMIESAFVHTRRITEDHIIANLNPKGPFFDQWYDFSPFLSRLDTIRQPEFGYCYSAVVICHGETEVIDFY